MKRKKKNFIKFFLNINRINSVEYYLRNFIIDFILNLIPFIIFSIIIYIYPTIDGFQVILVWEIKIFLSMLFNIILSYIFGIWSRNGKSYFYILKFFSLFYYFLIYIKYRDNNFNSYLNLFLIPEFILFYNNSYILLLFNFWVLIIILFIVDFYMFNYKFVKPNLIGYKSNENMIGYDENSINKEIEISNKNENLIINFNHVAKRYNIKQKTILNDLSFSIKKSERFTILGKNSSGKSTILNLICGLIRRSEGNIFLFNKKIKEENIYKKEKIGVCVQENFLWELFTTKYHFNFYNKVIRGNKNYMKKLIKFLDLEPLLDKKIYELSQGNKRKVSLRISLLNCPKLLIMDETTYGVDTLMRNKIRIFLNELKKNFNTSIWMVTHKMRDVEILSDKISLLINGNFIFINKTIDLYEKYNGSILSFNFESIKSNTFEEGINNNSKLSSFNLKKLYEDYDSMIFIKFGDENLIDLYEKCYELKSKGIILNFNIRNINLEDVYLFLTKE